jgi:hypothetical protein
VTDTQALIKFMMGKKVMNDRSHQAFLSADKVKVPSSFRYLDLPLITNDPEIRASEFVDILE